MLLKPCVGCEYHEIKNESDEQSSSCLKENCSSRYSTCLAQKALNRFLNGERPRQDRLLSALTDLNSWE